MTFTVIHTALASVVVVGLWSLIRHFLTRSPLDNLPGPQPVSWWKGNLPQFYDPTAKAWEFHGSLPEKYGRVVKLSTLWGGKALYVSDPLALYHVVVKDRHIYERFEMGLKSTLLLLGPGLLGTAGHQHNKQRKMLNPVFNIRHMRHMAPMFYSITKQLRDVLAAKVKNGPQEIDMLYWLTHVAIELVGQGGLGYSFDVLHEGAVSPYAQSMKALIPTLAQSIILRRIGLRFMHLGSPKFRRWIVDMWPQKNIQKIKDMTDIIDKTAVEIYQSKMTALKEGDDSLSKQIGQGKDIMSILLKANTEATEEERLSKAEVLGQVSTFMFAAMDTTSSALSRILHLLALHPDVQEKLRQEVTEAQKDGELSYDELDKLSYLDAVCRESLRVYCPAPWVTRDTCQDSILPLSSPIKGVDGTDIRQIHVPKGTQVFVGIMAANRSKAIWGEDAHEWKPERWLKPLPDSVSEAHLPGVYSNMMTFLGGGRACIGFKFSELEMKIVLSVLIESFRFSPASKDITWSLAGIVSPRTAGSKPPQLLLKVESVAHR